jgi:hypothetical protein
VIHGHHHSINAAKGMPPSQLGVSNHQKQQSMLPAHLSIKTPNKQVNSFMATTSFASGMAAHHHQSVQSSYQNRDLDLSYQN